MDFLKFLIFNILLAASHVYCDQLKLSCVEKDSNTNVSGFTARFYLSTREKRNNNRIKSKGDKLKKFLDNKGFKNHLKTVVLIHGFLNNHKASWVAELKGNLTRKQKLNVIQMDWSDAFFNKHIEVDENYDVFEELTEGMTNAFTDYFYYDDSSEEDDKDDEDDSDDDPIIPEELNPLDYRSAALRTELAANKLARLLIIVANTRPSPKKFLESLHLIGHSLGAHVVGQAGRLLRQHTGVQVKRITGLDPAYPCFDPRKQPKLKLDVNDAKFVDVIHSNSKPGEEGNFGTYEALGHIDFYPHRGYNQPNCDINRQGKSLDYLKDLAKTVLVETLRFITMTVANVDASKIALNYLNSQIQGSNERFDIICDHGEAPKYFTQSLSWNLYAVPTKTPIYDNMIRNLTYQLRNCYKTRNCVKMGYHAVDSADKPGKYYADTII